jgi:hypothetical protein
MTGDAVALVTVPFEGRPDNDNAVGVVVATTTVEYGNSVLAVLVRLIAAVQPSPGPKRLMSV